VQPGDSTRKRFKADLRCSREEDVAHGLYLEQRLLGREVEGDDGDGDLWPGVAVAVVKHGPLWWVESLGEAVADDVPEINVPDTKLCWRHGFFVCDI